MHLVHSFSLFIQQVFIGQDISARSIARDTYFGEQNRTVPVQTAYCLVRLAKHESNTKINIKLQIWQVFWMRDTWHNGKYKIGECYLVCIFRQGFPKGFWISICSLCFPGKKNGYSFSAKKNWNMKMLMIPRTWLLKRTQERPLCLKQNKKRRDD